MPKGSPLGYGLAAQHDPARIAVVVRLDTLSRDFLCFYGLALTRGQGDQDIIIPSKTVDVLIQVTLSRATAIFFRLGCALCSINADMRWMDKLSTATLGCERGTATCSV